MILDNTANPPSPKIPIKANFCCFGIWSDHSVGIGSVYVMKSVVIVRAALAR
jgi:hypothetical protein